MNKAFAKLWLRRLLRFVFSCFVLLLLMITVEIFAGWRCHLQSNIPATVVQPKERAAQVAGIKDYLRPEEDTYLSLPEW